LYRDQQMHNYRASTTTASTHRLCIYSQHIDGLHENCNNKMILVHFIINRTIVIL